MANIFDFKYGVKINYNEVGECLPTLETIDVLYVDSFQQTCSLFCAWRLTDFDYLQDNTLIVELCSSSGDVLKRDSAIMKAWQPENENDTCLGATIMLQFQDVVIETTELYTKIYLNGDLLGTYPLTVKLKEGD